MAAHAVGDNKESRFNIDEEAVFVAFSDGAGVGSGDGIKLHEAPSAGWLTIVDDFVWNKKHGTAA